jgi:hypothetical protein
VDGGRAKGLNRHPAATRSEVKRCGLARLNMRKSGVFPLERRALRRS